MKEVYFRLSAFINHIGIPVSQFERKCGFSNGYVRSVSNSIGSDKLRALSDIYPELSIEWLLTGKGDMLKGATIINNSGISISGGNSGNNTIDNRRYDSDSPDVLKKQIEDLERTIAERERLLEEKEVRIKEKDTQIKEKDTQIKEKDTQIKEKDTQIKTLLDIIACKQGQ